MCFGRQFQREGGRSGESSVAQRPLLAAEGLKEIGFRSVEAAEGSALVEQVGEAVGALL